MVNVQQGFSSALELSKRKRLCQSPRTTLNWSDEDEQAYQKAVDKCRTGKVWWMTQTKAAGHP